MLQSSLLMGISSIASTRVSAGDVAKRLAISLFVALPYVERRCCQMVCNGLSVGAFCIQSLVNMMVPSSPKTGTLVDRFTLSLENVMLSKWLATISLSASSASKVSKVRRCRAAYRRACLLIAPA